MILKLNVTWPCFHAVRHSCVCQCFYPHVWNGCGVARIPPDKLNLNKPSWCFCGREKDTDGWKGKRERGKSERHSERQTGLVWGWRVRQQLYGPCLTLHQTGSEELTGRCQDCSTDGDQGVSSSCSVWGHIYITWSKWPNSDYFPAVWHRSDVTHECVSRIRAE